MAPRACVRVYARVLVPPNLYIYIYTIYVRVYACVLVPPNLHIHTYYMHTYISSCICCIPLYLIVSHRLENGIYPRIHTSGGLTYTYWMFVTLADTARLYTYTGYRVSHEVNLWCGAAGLCARVRACAGAAESLHTYIRTVYSISHRILNHI